MTPTAMKCTYVKPITCEERLLIEVLTHKYQGVPDTPFLVFEDAESITVTIPRTLKPFMESQA